MHTGTRESGEGPACARAPGRLEKNPGIQAPASESVATENLMVIIVGSTDPNKLDASRMHTCKRTLAPREASLPPQLIAIRLSVWM